MENTISLIPIIRCENWNDGVKVTTVCAMLSVITRSVPEIYGYLYGAYRQLYQSRFYRRIWKASGLHSTTTVLLSNHDWLRSICVDKLYYNEDGTIQMVKQRK